MGNPARMIEQNERKVRRSGLIAAARRDRDGRATVEIAVRLRVGEQTTRAIARNVSVGGMFVAMDEPPAYGTELVVEVPLPGLTELASIQATVRWTNEEGMGLQFGVMGVRETHGLLAIVRSDASVAAPSTDADDAQSA